MLYEKSDDLNISRFMLDLDRGIYHENFSRGQIDQMRNIPLAPVPIQRTWEA